MGQGKVEKDISEGGFIMLLKNKVALVTGSARGIGRAIALAFAREGSDVVINDLDIDKGEKVVREVKKIGRKSFFVKADISKKKEVQKLVNRILDEFSRIDILVNNAGILKHSLMLEMEEKDWDEIFEVNVKGTFLCSQAVGKIMKAQKSGKIINISSASGKKPTQEEGAYCASKSAVISLSRVLALELGPCGINVNTICPGFTVTEMVKKLWLTTAEIEKEFLKKTALKKLGQPEDQAKVAVFLASSLSDHITGQAITVSGGELMI